MEHHRRNFLDTLGLFPARCVMAALLGLLLAAGNAAAENALWMANENSPTLAEFQGTLKSGSKKPYGLINDANDLDAASTIAFDQNGNLWVTNFNANTISEFTKSQWGAAQKASASHRRHHHLRGSWKFSERSGGDRFRLGAKHVGGC